MAAFTVDSETVHTPFRLYRRTDDRWSIDR